MKRSDTKLCLVAVISLLLSVIWHSPASAAVAPAIASLGRISEGLEAPGRLDADAAGNLYVADSRVGAVLKYDKFGKLVRTFGAVPAAGTGVAVTPDGSRLYVAGKDVVAILDGATGAVLGYLGSDAGEFEYTGEIDLDAAGYVFAADSGSKFVKVYNADGVFQYQFGGLGIDPGQFRTIWAMSVNEQAGEVYVADIAAYSTSKPKVQVFDLAGNLQTTRTLLASSAFGSPSVGFFGGMAFDQDGRGYFLDAFRANVRMLGLPSTLLATYGVTGYDVGQLKGPQDAVYDPSTGRLFVTCEGARVEVFGIDGGQNPAATNKVPGLPLPVSPVADSEVPAASPELVFQNAVDPDVEDTLTYEVKVLDGEAIAAEYPALPEGEGTSSVQLDVALVENARYRWAVQAYDGEDVSGWSGLQSFYVNAVEEAPSIPVLSAPLAGETLNGEGLLSWQAAVDPDPFDVVGYLVEFAADAAFGEIALEEAVTGTSVALAGLADYGALEDGAAYFWRVKSVDGHGLASESSEAGSFVYDTTILKVTANMPGAKVYLGGNHGYAGRFAGEAPLDLRDFVAGASSVVVERAGFEPFIAQVRPAAGENVEVYAALVPAITSADLKARPLEAAGAKIHLVGDSAPFAVDFDNDGLVDLLVGDAAGTVTLFKGTLDADGGLAFTAGVGLGLPLTPGAAPFVVDWDNDGRKDLLVGSEDGTVTLFRNVGSEEVPVLDPGALLQASGVPINVGAAAVPAVADIDGDGDKDLVVGARLFANGGSDEEPQLAPAGKLVPLSGAVAPFFADWDGDGGRELLLAASEHLYRYVRQADGSYAAAEVLSVASDLLGGNGQSVAGAFSLGDRLRLFALDFDGDKGKDLLVGNAAGEVRLVASHGSDPVAAFIGALLDKVSQIDVMVGESASQLAPQVEEISAAIESGNLKDAGKLVKSLAAEVADGTELANIVSELDALF